MRESGDRTPSGGLYRRTDLVSVHEHERNLRQLKCVVTERHGVTLHHCHGGSMLEIIGANPGVGQRSNPFYQIPLVAEYHTGEFGIDSGQGEFGSPVRWEEAFGTQLSHLHEVNSQLPYDIWLQAGLWFAEERWK